MATQNGADISRLVVADMLPDSIRRYLADHQAEYRILSHQSTHTLEQACTAAGVPMQRMLRAVVLIDGQGLLMAVLPADHILDFSALCRQLNRQFDLVPGAQLTAIFDDCESYSYPPLAPAYGMDVIVDHRVTTWDRVHFEPGTHRHVLSLRTSVWLNLLGDYQRGDFARPISVLTATPDAESADIDVVEAAVEQFTPAGVRRALQDFHELPPLPVTAQHLLELGSDPNADARKLAQVVELDPPLAAQVIRYANSPLYGYAGKILDVRSAIARVLGFDFVLNLGLGISIGKALKIPPDGPLGLNAYWRHSVYCAALVEKLAQQLPPALKVKRGTAYVAGLLHNLGVPLLGQVFQSEFFLLNRFVMANPQIPLQTIEKYVIGVRHDQIGAWLMESWKMPAELIAAVRHHHDPEYWGPHAVYSQLILMANHLLKRRQIGDDSLVDIPPFTLQTLGIDAAQAIQFADDLLEGCDELDALATRLAA